MEKITVRDIARMADVSPTAVSFALNGKTGISPETRRKILSVIQQVNYKPTQRNSDSCGQSIRFNRIAVIFRQDIQPIDMLFYTELNTSVMRACSTCGIDMLVTQPLIKKGDFRLPGCLLAKDVDGVLVYGDINRSYVDRIRSMGVPVVELDSSRVYDGQIAVHVDYRKAAYLATKHLIQCGHRDIAYIGNEELHDFNLLIFGGFQEVISSQHYPLDLSRVQLNVRDEDSVKGAINALLSTQIRPTAIFCATDLYAIYAMRYLQQRGLRVPEDISVIGIDDIELSKFTSPALTTVRIDRETLGRAGFDLLMNCIESNFTDCVTIEPTQLIHRGSTLDRLH